LNFEQILNNFTLYYFKSNLNLTFSEFWFPKSVVLFSSVFFSNAKNGRNRMRRERKYAVRNREFLQGESCMGIIFIERTPRKESLSMWNMNNLSNF